MEILEFFANAKNENVSERTLCKHIAVTARTLQNWRKNGLTDKRKGSVRHVPHRLSEEEAQSIYDIANSQRFADQKPENIVAILATEGTYIASASTLYRILRKRKALQHRQETKKPIRSQYHKWLPVTGPNQVFTWDITWLKTDVVGLFKYAYNVMDVYDRSLVGWTIEENESDEHAHRLFARIIRDLKVSPLIVHADNGNPMRGVSLGAMLDSLNISRSYSRPRCSNDNAHIESFHKTLKYTVGYPAFFTSLLHARTWYANFIAWYNNDHLHSGLDYVTPNQVRTGKADQIFQNRNRTIAEAQKRNPLRWRTGKIRTYTLKPIQVFYRPLQKAC